MSEQSPAERDRGALTRELVGHVWIDSGQLVLTDPLYLEELDSEVIDALTSLRQRSALVNDGMAVAFRMGVRNTRHPVYVTRFENGALARIEVVLDERLETPEG